MLQNGRKKKETHAHRHVPTEYHFVTVYNTGLQHSVDIGEESHESAHLPRSPTLDTQHARFRDLFIQVLLALFQQDSITFESTCSILY